MLGTSKYLTKSMKLTEIARRTFAKAVNAGAEEIAPTEAEIKAKEERMRILHARLSKQRDRYAVDSEDCRIDFGLIIDRNPIFLYVAEQEMDWLKYRFASARKYNYMIPLPKDAMDFTQHNPTDSFVSQNLDNIATHRIKHEDGSSTTYSANSSHFSLTDPNITDHHSIQYAAGNRTYFLVKEKGSDKWTFPVSSLQDNTNLSDARAFFFSNLVESKWEVAYGDLLPLLVEKRDLTEKEREEPKNKRVKSVKVFYLPARFHRGTMNVNLNMYSDYAWATRLDLNKFFDRDTYNRFVHHTLIY